MDLREVEYDGRDWIKLPQDRDRWRAYVRAAMNLRVLKRHFEARHRFSDVRHHLVIAGAIATISSNRCLQFVQCMIGVYKLTPSNGPKERSRRARDLTVLGQSQCNRISSSPDLEALDFHLFELMKDRLRGQHFPDKDAVIAAVTKWLASAG
ncbi:hypothetical protein ANN_23407 [Periplaneta americana]|uniref:Uncharacterized protein n=1 Tax=Periplaneta americana TaxID=6978 RepID=A0ABQ8SM19_PERAM|nr:hypothetical protein ANN_23407 [Periplaneta americana]